MHLNDQHNLLPELTSSKASQKSTVKSQSDSAKRFSGQLESIEKQLNTHKNKELVRGANRSASASKYENTHQDRRQNNDKKVSDSAHSAKNAMNTESNKSIEPVFKTISWGKPLPVQQTSAGINTIVINASAKWLKNAETEQAGDNESHSLSEHADATIFSENLNHTGETPLNKAASLSLVSTDFIYSDLNNTGFNGSVLNGPDFDGADLKQTDRLIGGPGLSGSYGFKPNLTLDDEALVGTQNVSMALKEKLQGLDLPLQSNNHNGQIQTNATSTLNKTSEDSRNTGLSETNTNHGTGILKNIETIDPKILNGTSSGQSNSTNSVKAAQIDPVSQGSVAKLAEHELPVLENSTSVIKNQAQQKSDFSQNPAIANAQNLPQRAHELSDDGQKEFQTGSILADKKNTGLAALEKSELNSSNKAVLRGQVTQMTALGSTVLGNVFANSLDASLDSGSALHSANYSESGAAIYSMDTAQSASLRMGDALQSNPQSLHLASPLSLRSNFAPNLAAKIQWVYSQSLQAAEVIMDPPELGPMTVKVNHRQGETNLIFHVNNLQTKEVLEDNLAKLKDLLQEQGLSLGNTEVKHQDSTAENGNEQNQGLSDSIEEELVDEIDKHHSVKLGLLDTYI